MKRKSICLIFIGVMLTLFSLQAEASELLPGMSDGQWYFNETFSDKHLDNNQVLDDKGKVIWQINTVEGQTNAITDTGSLQLGDARYMQRAVLAEELWGNKQNYAMEFTINVQKLGNTGHSGRPIVAIIPRSKDKEFNEYYAVTYYMDLIDANLYKCKWAIINTAAPSKMEPLVEGYYMLREDVDYTARLAIQNTYEGNVNIKFYIDGPVNPVDEFKPLLEYTDSSPFKISSGVTGPSFGMVGYSNDGWGISPIVRYDNIRLYDLYQFKKYEEQLEKYALIGPNDIALNKAYGEIKYLINRGIIGSYSDNSFRPHEFVSVGQFLKMLITLKGEKYPEGESHWADNYINRGIELGIIEKNEFSNYNKLLTKYEVALMITRFNGKPAGDKTYVSFIKDNGLIPDKYLNAVLYTYYEGYLRLNDNLRFMGNNLVNQSEVATIILRILDAGFRKVNYSLELPHILSSGAVLQGNKKIPIWGRGVSGETITVRFKNQVKTTVVKNGYWYLELGPEPYGGPYTLSVNNTNDTIKLEDIKVGEVFIVAGQSNAEMYLYECSEAEETKKKFLGNSNLRFFSGEQIMAVRPNFTNVGQWNPSYDWVIDYSPAIGTFFVEKLLELNKGLANVPIGVIPITYGGSTIEVLMPNYILEENNYIQKDNEPIMSGFWNGFMEAVAPYGAKAVMYYQGENSTQLGYDYEPLLRDYIRGFREEFKDPNLPFMLVQISGYGENYYEFNLDSWPIIREIQMKVANTTHNTGIVTTIDLSDPNPMEIHPKEKKPIGERLAYLAMKRVYNKDLGHSSPVAKFYNFENNKVIVGFEYTYGPIYLKDDIPKGFEILDDNNKWHEAQAKVNQLDNTVIIWHDNILLPKGVRYAWRNYPGYSLYNNVDFPAFPFEIINVPDHSGLNVLKISDHLLNNNDAIVNITRNNQFRMVEIFDRNTITHVYVIAGQTAGDTIERFSRGMDSTAQEGTTETIIKISKHGLSVGDWIRNNTRGWEPRRVNAILDEDTLKITAIKKQTAGDDIERYKFIGKVVAE